MVNNINIELMFARDYRERLQETLATLKEQVTAFPLPQDQYSTKVGQIQAYTDALEVLNELMKHCFGQEN